MMEDLKLRIGLRMRDARKQKGFTQAQLAEAVDKTFETISNIERGKTAPNFHTLCDISVVLGVPMREFFDQGDLNGDETLSRRRLELLQQAKNLAEKMQDRQLDLWTRMGRLMTED